VQEFFGRVRSVVDPIPEVVPTPALLPSVALASTPTPTTAPTATPAVSPTPTVPASPTPIPPSPTPLPGEVTLTGFKHEYQAFNNCGPASLAMTLSFWQWAGDQKTAANALKPIQDDKNVSPIELYEYAVTQGFDGYIRVNGDIDTLRRFIAAGYPVLVEKGFTCAPGENCSDWFGHYSVFAGYNDAEEYFVLQDSFRGPNIKITYAELMENWRAFNFLYVVLFPASPEHDARVQALLGPAADLEQNYAGALAHAREEAQTLTGRDAAFAWFNVGTNLHYQNDYLGAANAYDESRRLGLPYRMLWYQFGPYRAYYYTGRYQEVADLATFAIDSVNSVPGLEEAYYWRGLARVALGQRDQAIEDFRTALQRHPGWGPAEEALAQQGVAP
jgi:tetratricopeptide (TPR) repeat protein